MLKTKICELFGIEYPIVQGGMAYVSEAPLAAAVSQAGGLGLIGASAMDAETLRKNILQVKNLTDKPFGVNLPMLRPDVEDLVNIIIAEKVQIVFTSAGNPAIYTKKFKEAGLKVVHVIASAKHAKKAEEKGVDAVVAEGFEAGGHDGVDEITTLILTPVVKDAVKIPVISAGGIVDARTAAAAFVLGADGVQLGTRFVASVECNAHQIYKQKIVESDETGTIFTARKYHPMRVLKSPFALKLYEMEFQGATKEQLRELTGPGRGYKGCIEGNWEEGLFNCGMGIGLVNEIKPAAEIIKDLVKGIEKIIKDYKIED